MIDQLRSLAAVAPGHRRRRGAGGRWSRSSSSGRDGITPDQEATAAIASACHQGGLLVLTAGTYGNVIRLLPPLTIPEDLLDEGMEILSKAVASA